MRIFTVTLLCFVIMSCASVLPAQDKKDVLGRWDLIVQYEGKALPSWLEVSKSGYNTLVGRFVYAFGSARPIAEVVEKNGVYSFSIPKQWEEGELDHKFSFTLKDGKINGTMVYVDGKEYSFTGVRAPKLPYDPTPTWGSPINLFNGKDLTGWYHQEEKKQWIVDNGVLKNPESGSNLITKEKFQDFKLHIEFRYPEGSNSGIYLRGRYEVQIADNAGMDPSSILFGGVYGFLTPTENMAKAPGEWQSYDITLIGNRVTIVANGVPVIIDQAIPGITGGAIDSQEGEPGPFLLQGDHGPVEFRNIILTPRVD